MDDFEITKREVLVSIIIVLLMLAIGFAIHGSISDSLIEGYSRYDTALQIENNADPLTKGIPEPFAEIYGKFVPESRKLMIEQCQSSLCRALFNKSAAQGFWTLFDRVYTLIMNNQEASVDFLYHALDEDVVDACPDFDVLSLKYFIAKVKEGILR